LSFLSIFIGFFAREAFVGAGADTWQHSINIFAINNFFETELSFIFRGSLAINKLFPLFITLSAALLAFALLLTWNGIVNSQSFRCFYTFINQK
jgi:hypothetical protein